MDAASQRGIGDIREIREPVVVQPAKGRYKVYILISLLKDTLDGEEVEESP
jgi:hypothetical protein